jgi:hypothetical protein
MSQFPLPTSLRNPTLNDPRSTGAGGQFVLRDPRSTRPWSRHQLSDPRSTGSRGG